MPNMANITVKKFDGATDIVWTGIQRSSGDKSPAVWRSDTVSTIPANRPRAEMTSRSNAKGTTRIMEFGVEYPIVASVNGVETVLGRQPIKVFIPVIQDLDATQVREAVAQGLNLASSVIVRAAFQEGYAPN